MKLFLKSLVAEEKRGLSNLRKVEEGQAGREIREETKHGGRRDIEKESIEFSTLMW